MISISAELPHHGAAIEALYDVCFGEDRFTKSSYAIRTGISPVTSLARVALDYSNPTDGAEGAADRLVGAIRFWPVEILCLVSGRLTEALLLGPFAVHPDFQGRKLGQLLMNAGMNAAFQANQRLILLVGDAAYYSRYGFMPLKPRTITMPGGRDADRLLFRQMTGLAQLPAVGVVQPAHVPTPIPTDLPDLPIEPVFHRVSAS